MSEILQDARVKLADHPNLYNRLRNIMIRDFTDSIENGFDTQPLKVEPEDASMKDESTATGSRARR